MNRAARIDSLSCLRARRPVPVGEARRPAPASRDETLSRLTGVDPAPALGNRARDTQHAVVLRHRVLIQQGAGNYDPYQLAPDGAVTNLCKPVFAAEPSRLQSVVETYVDVSVAYICCPPAITPTVLRDCISDPISNDDTATVSSPETFRDEPDQRSPQDVPCSLPRRGVMQRVRRNPVLDRRLLDSSAQFVLGLLRDTAIRRIDRRRGVNVGRRDRHDTPAIPQVVRQARHRRLSMRRCVADR